MWRQWVEEAIGRYYGQNRPDYDGIHRQLRDNEKTETCMILRPQFWRGQQHGGRRMPSHARHMRPLCDSICENPKTVQQTPKNIVLFTPYLHWETDRQRHRFAEHIESVTESHHTDKESRDFYKKRCRIEKRSQLPKPGWMSRLAKIQKELDEEAEAKRERDREAKAKRERDKKAKAKHDRDKEAKAKRERDPNIQKESKDGRKKEGEDTEQQNKWVVRRLKKTADHAGLSC